MVLPKNNKNINALDLTEQIENIKSYGLSSVLCDTLDNPVAMQEKALLQPWEGRINNRMYVTQPQYTAHAQIILKNVQSNWSHRTT